ncbi:hypothetical protein BJY14_003996 [Actinomadura luteofluorescens]|uniref:Uncharacterized protein n=1 Tax=Actinomadura luteofluorescens TaxID=46163 RepID=A0A7Y9EHX7_9ACTN|nr:hypothetical protein [Actinomadura luteofluorescens]NYD48013.1 hypothetical protein [Actinomadura luteofluorescens]
MSKRPGQRRGLDLQGRRPLAGAIHLGYAERSRRVLKKVSGRTRNEVAGKLRNLRKLVDAGTVHDDRFTINAFLECWSVRILPGTVAESAEDDYRDTVSFGDSVHSRPKPRSRLVSRGTITG